MYCSFYILAHCFSFLVLFLLTTFKVSALKLEDIPLFDYAKAPGYPGFHVEVLIISDSRRYTLDELGIPQSQLVANTGCTRFVKDGVDKIEVSKGGGVFVTAHISLARFPQTPLQPSKAVEKIPEIAVFPAKYEQLRVFISIGVCGWCNTFTFSTAYEEK